MKLIELFEDRAVSFNFDNSNLPKLGTDNTSVKVGTFDSYVIWGSRHYGDNFDAYCIKGEGNFPLAIVVISSRERLVDGHKFQEIEKMWVDKDSRGKSYAVAIIGFLVAKLKIALSSGSLVTSDGQKFLNKLITTKSFKFKVLDNDKVEPLELIGVEKLFSIPNKFQLLITESWATYNNRFENLLLKELWKFRGVPGWD